MRWTTPLIAALLGACTGHSSPEIPTDVVPTPESNEPPACAISNRGIEICDGEDNDCDGEADEWSDLEATFQVGQACSTSVGACKPGLRDCVDGQPVCGMGGIEPVRETCDGLDNDCDGDVDEAGDLRRSQETGERCGMEAGVCELGIQRCEEGALVCKYGIEPTAEECDGLDNDCDGDIDELSDLEVTGIVGAACGNEEGPCQLGLSRCVGGILRCEGAVEASAEVCDGLDNDCDGEADEFGDLAALGIAGGRCGMAEGNCEPGILECVNGLLSCAGEVPPQEELCDEGDNDCDGAVDEDFEGLGEPCGEGACAGGRRQCDPDDALGTTCSSANLSMDEDCDGIDNDCDGATDEIEDLGAAIGEICGEEVGRCITGVQACVAGAWLCEGSVAPLEELCNGEDDDCDGEVDEALAHCQDGEFVCEPAFASDELCDGVDNDCDEEVDEDVEAVGRACQRFANGCNRSGRYRCVAGDLDCGPPPNGEGACLALPEEVEPNNTIGQCNPVQVQGHRVSGVVRAGGDRDFFCFDVLADQRVRFSIEARARGSQLDSYIYLWQLDPLRDVARNDDFSGLDSQLDIRFEQAGRYALEVAAYWDRGCDACSYDLVLTTLP